MGWVQAGSSASVVIGGGAACGLRLLVESRVGGRRDRGEIVGKLRYQEQGRCKSGAAL